MVKTARACGLLRPMNAAHSQAPISTRTVTSQMVAIGGRPSITPSSTATSTIAVSTRCLSTRGLLRLLAHLFARQAEAALASAECGERSLEVRLVEIRPQHIADVDLGIGEIPQQEIADAMIAAGADEQVRIRHVAEAEFFREARLVDGVDTDGAACDFRGQLARRLQDVPASAVTHGHLQPEAGVGGHELLARGHPRL